MTVTYRTPVANDAAALAALARETFCETFAHLYSAEDLDAFLAKTKSVAATANAIADPRQPIRIAEEDGALIGYCKVGLHAAFEDWPSQGRHQVELKELYIRSGYQGVGVARVMMEWALDQARGASADEMVLSVWSGNDRAQAFYRKHGFDWVANTYFMVGNQRDDEFLFARCLP